MLDELKKAFDLARRAAGDAVALLKHHTVQSFFDAIDARLARLEALVGVAEKATEAAVAVTEAAQSTPSA